MVVLLATLFCAVQVATKVADALAAPACYGTHHAMAFHQHTKRQWLASLRATTGDEKEAEEMDDGWDDTGDSTFQRTQDRSRPESLQSARSQPAKEEPERDLFIPIFTAISVIGFGGLYAYETFRLYLNGELYLPGGN